MHRVLMALATVAILLPGLASAQIAEVTIRVDGLSCPFCAYSLEKNLKAVTGVASLSIDVETGIATIVPDDEVRLDFAALPAVVKKAGFTAREIGAVGVGRIATVENQPALVDLNGATLFILETNDVLAGLASEGNPVLDFAGTVLPGGQDQQPAVERLALTTATVRPGRKDG